MHTLPSRAQVHRRSLAFLPLAFGLALASGCGSTSSSPISDAGPDGATDHNNIPGSQKTPGGSEAGTAPPPEPGVCFPNGPCIEADVTLTDGSTFHFVETGIVSGSNGTVSIDARNEAQAIGLSLLFKPNAVTVNTPYSSELGGTVNAWIYRPHPTDPTKTRATGAKGGPIQFSQVGSAVSRRFDGTFDAITLDRDDPADTVHIRFERGSFRGYLPN